MATWRDIATSETDAESPVTETLMAALANNPVALAEGASGAPVSVAGWHPYNQAEYQDGSTGLFYDFSVDGAVANIDTPNFQNGYEYRVIYEAVQWASGGTPRIDFLNQTTLSYVTGAYTSNAGLNTDVFYGDLEIPLARLNRNLHMIHGPIRWVDGGGIASWISVTAGLASGFTAQKVRAVRLTTTLGGNTSAGKAYLLRRRNDLSR